MSQSNQKYLSAKLTQGQNNRRDNRLMKCNNARLQQSCIKFKKFKRSSIELTFNSSSKFLSFLSFMKEREGNFELELKVSSFELLVNFLNSIQLCYRPLIWQVLFSTVPPSNSHVSVSGPLKGNLT